MTSTRNSAYVAALRMLARRDLSEAQMRERLTRREHDPDDIERAIAQLRTERALDDARVAEAIARNETGVKRRGRHRVRRQIESAGISPVIARQAVETVFAEVDAEALLESALDRRLRGQGTIDDRAAQRLYRALLAQGFDSDQILRAIDARRRRS